MRYKLEHKTKKKVFAGKYYPLGAILLQDGINFAIYSNKWYEI